MASYEFYFYSPKLPELGDTGSLVSWLREEFTAAGYTKLPTITDGEFQNVVSIRAPGVCGACLSLETGLGRDNCNTAYCIKYAGLPDEIIDQIQNAKIRLSISLGPEDENHPEDCVDLVSFFSEIETSCFFGVIESHRKKMAQFKKTVTKNWVIKHLLPGITPELNSQGFVREDLSFKHSDGRKLEFTFRAKASDLYTRGSYRVDATKDYTTRIVHSKDNCPTRYIEPDGSNIEEHITELQELLKLSLSLPPEEWMGFGPWYPGKILM